MKLMKTSTVRLAALFLGALFVAGIGEADAQVRFGPQAALWDFSDVGVGARVNVELGESFGIEDGAFRTLFGSANVNYVFLDGDGTPLLFNVNAAVPFSRDGAASPYAGAGLNHFRFSFEGFSATSSGLNVLGGLFFDLGSVPAFAELQYSTTGSGYLTLTGGILFGGS